jgi:hypothetical protein
MLDTSGIRAIDLHWHDRGVANRRRRRDSGDQKSFKYVCAIAMLYRNVWLHPLALGASRVYLRV